MCVFMLQQYEAQLCDPLTLSKTSSGVEDSRLKDELHSDTQLLAGRACAFGMLPARILAATDDLYSLNQVFLTNLADILILCFLQKWLGCEPKPRRHRLVSRGDPSLRDRLRST